MHRLKRWEFPNISGIVNKSKLKSLTQSLAQNKSLLFITRSIIPFVVIKNFYTVFVVVIVWLFAVITAIIIAVITANNNQVSSYLNGG